MESIQLIPLRLSVTDIDGRQFRIESNFEETDGSFDDRYISFSGFSGKFSPHMFAAAPDLFEALKLLLSSAHDHQTGISEAEAALSKALGGNHA